MQLAEQPQHRTVGGITWERCRPSVPTAVVGFLLPSLLPYGCFLAQPLFSALRKEEARPSLLSDSALEDRGLLLFKFPT